MAPPDISDDFLGRFLRGDRDVLEQIYRETFTPIWRSTGRILREPADRDAIVHEVFADLMSRRDLRASFKGGDLAAWLGAIARHRAIDYARREQRLVNIDTAGDPGTEAGPLDDFRQELERFMTRLSPERRDLVRLRWIAGMTQVEAAAALGVPRSTLEDWEHQAKSQLSRYLLDGEGGVAPS